MSKVVDYRRDFHKYAEISWKEIRTSAKIAEILDSFGYKNILLGHDVVDYDTIIEPVRLTPEEIETEMNRAREQGAKEEWLQKTSGLPGVIVEFDTKKEGPVSAFRFDIDSLPYDEWDDKDFRPVKECFASVNKESIHACGHDGHTSIGLGLAYELINNDIIKCGKVRLIFQPAEESYSGAKSIVAKGYLDDVNHFVAIHLALTADGKPLPSNSICCGCKDFLSVTQWDVTFHGKAAHPCGASQEGKNAILAACSATLNIHTITQHEAGIFRANVGEIRGGVCTNTIAPEATICLEFRGDKPEIAQYARDRVAEIIKGAAMMHDVTYSIKNYDDIPVSKSDDAMMEKIKDAASKVDWFEKIYFEGNIGGTDDAAVMMDKVQQNGGIATYLGIGTDTTDFLHGTKFDFDEDCLDAAVEMCAKLLSDVHK